MISTGFIASLKGDVVIDSCNVIISDILGNNIRNRLVDSGNNQKVRELWRWIRQLVNIGEKFHNRPKILLLYMIGWKLINSILFSPVINRTGFALVRRSLNKFIELVYN